MENEEQQEQTRALVRPNGAPSAQPIHTPQYLDGFSGMATEPFPESARAVLAEAVNPAEVEIKPDGIVFAPGVWYRRQLTRAFGPGGWGLAMRGPVRTMPQQNGGDLVVYHGALVCLGRFVAEAHGQCVYWPKNSGMTYADAVEGARTDCITRCCKDLGMATELWDAGWRARWMTDHALKAWVPGSGDKGKWHFWRRDRETPWQVTKAGAKPQPAAEAPGAPAAPVPAISSPAAAPPADDGEVAEEDDLTELDRLVFQSLKWKPDYAGRWLNARFGTRAPSSLSKEQLKTAFRLLYAFARGKEAYDAELSAEKAAGLVKA